MNKYTKFNDDGFIDDPSEMLVFMQDAVKSSEPVLLGRVRAFRILTTMLELKKENKALYETIESMKRTNQALIKRLRLNIECFEAIADSNLSSETDYILEQNRLFKQIASDAIEGE